MRLTSLCLNETRGNYALNIKLDNNLKKVQQSTFIHHDRPGILVKRHTFFVMYNMYKIK